MSSSTVDVIYDYDHWLKKQWALEEAKEQLRAYNASRSLHPSYVFDQDIDRRLDELAAREGLIFEYISEIKA